MGGKKRDYPGEESEERHRDVEPRHDEEKQNAVLENSPQQPAHVRLAVVSLQLQGEDDNANGGENVCKGVRRPDICEAVVNSYQRTRPVTCRPTLRSWGQ